MEMQSVKSSNVSAVGYDEENKTLTVEFRSGGIYQYAGVPPEMYADLLEADSVLTDFQRWSILRAWGRWSGDLCRLLRSRW